ncbi:MAG: acetate uptake transporter family protein [Solirubrobacterales bacterium]
MEGRNGHGELAEVREHTRVVLQPIAAPSILGLFGFAGATFIVAAHLAGWYGGEKSPEFLFPFAAMFGGLAQFLAGMWAFKARDGIAIAMHGMWGSFWLAYGLLNLLVAIGVYTLPTGAFPELGFWFIALSVITALGAVAAVAESLGLTTVLTTLAVGAGFLALHYLTGEGWWETAGGWILIASAVAATYTAGAMMLESAWGRVILPLGKVEREANVPGTRIRQPIQFEHQEPGVRMGQ